ncbi:MAG: hypothetical protein Q8761_02910, partial [Sweet potato little leaf phytoplasma]|nr:hypothetical protein [Sweet potato little leaf phytoplasma]
MESTGFIDDVERQLRISLKADLQEVSLQEARFWSQRCKKIWLSDGDENTSFFHKICCARRRRSFIVELVSKSGSSLVIDKDLEEEVLAHFTSIYEAEPEQGGIVENIDWQPISSDKSMDMIRPFSDSEVLDCLKSFGNNKAPGPDRFTIEFFKKSWNTLKPSIMQVFHDFFRNGIVNCNVNETYIALVPKRSKSQKISDYRPISLTTSLYKIIAKVLAERLKPSLMETVSIAQSTFIKGRHITD